jgi:hypothetical protein
MRRALLIVLAACAPTTRDACLSLGTEWCERLWLCVVEHSRASPAFIAHYGHSLQACAELYADECTPAFSCGLTDAREQHCAALTDAANCAALYAARDNCLQRCQP